MQDLPIYRTDRVKVTAHWSQFYGETGLVVGLEPTMVILDGYREPIRIDRVSLELETDS